jgi:hypothetical protein
MLKISNIRFAWPFNRAFQGRALSVPFYRALSGPFYRALSGPFYRALSVPLYKAFSE